METFFFKFWVCCISFVGLRLLLPGAQAPGHLGSLVAPTSMWDLSSHIRDRTHIPCIGIQILNHWTSRQVPVETFLRGTGGVSDIYWRLPRRQVLCLELAWSACTAALTPAVRRLQPYSDRMFLKQFPTAWVAASGQVNPSPLRDTTFRRIRPSFPEFPQIRVSCAYSRRLTSGQTWALPCLPHPGASGPLPVPPETTHGPHPNSCHRICSWGRLAQDHVCISLDASREQLSPVMER